MIKLFEKEMQSIYKIKLVLSDCISRLNSAKYLVSIHRYKDSVVLIQSLLIEFQSFDDEVHTLLKNHLILQVDTIIQNHFAITPYDREPILQISNFPININRDIKKKILTGLKNITGQIEQRKRIYYQCKKQIGKKNKYNKFVWVIWLLLLSIAIFIILCLLGLYKVKSIDLVDSGTAREYIVTEGFGDNGYHGPIHWLQGLGPESHIRFLLDREQNVSVHIRFMSYLFQNVTVHMNGSNVYHIDNVFPRGIMDANFDFRGIKGFNDIYIEYSDWNYMGTQIPHPEDPRPISVWYTFLTISVAHDLLRMDSVEN